MKKSLTLSLTDEELIELQRIILDGDKEEALRFLQKHFKNKAQACLECGCQCKPQFEIQG